MTDKTIHLVFKTHLDIGFTDHAEKVRRQYNEQFIPQALNTAEHFYAEDATAPAFVWTTGAWLIWDHLNSQDASKVARLERAIDRGLIAWHGLPYTTHTELMSPALFRAGLSYSQELDQRFGKTTIAAKMTDVPGHTLGMVPLLAEAGIRFLHLGVNTASPVPDVPPIFRWRAPSGEEVVVMYQGSYGETDFPAGSEIGLSFAHTEDNIGPQSVGQTVGAYRALAHEHPGVTVVASTLDAFGAEMWTRREDFPVVDIEIGDSWIHGAGADPVKIARFRQLQRLYDGYAQDSLTPERLAPQRFPELLALGLGLTDLNKTEVGSDHELTPEAMDAQSLHAKLRRFRPAAIAFTSKNAASLALGIKAPSYGRQVAPLEGAVAFVLASPSGRARSFWTLEPWKEAAAFVAERRHLRGRAA